MINGRYHPGSFPVSSLSMNILENTGFIIPIREEMTPVMITNAIAAPQPASLPTANSRVDFCLPSGTKPSEGANIIQMPVNFSSNSFIETV